MHLPPGEAPGWGSPAGRGLSHVSCWSERESDTDSGSLQEVLRGVSGRRQRDSPSEDTPVQGEEQQGTCRGVTTENLELPRGRL